MDREVVEQKLESLRRCLRRIETKCPTDAATLVADIDLQDISRSISVVQCKSQWILARI